MQVPQLHNAAEMQQISNLAHIVEGLLIGLAAILALAETALVRRGLGKRAIFAWPILIFLSGTFLSAYLLIPHHGLERAKDQWAFVWYDPQQRQHLLIAVLILGGAGLELIARHRTATTNSRSTGNLLWFGWPFALAAVGLLFLTHPQHGTSEAVERATAIHRVLGLLLLSAGMVRAAEQFETSKKRVLGKAWPMLLLAAAALLLIYREPEGAYEQSDPKAGNAAMNHRVH